MPLAGQPVSDLPPSSQKLSFDFTFHALKANGISDLEGSLTEKQAISGHKSISQTARYDRKTKIVPVVGGQQLFSARA
ncbi:integrase [Serratia marcescens]|uniref:integrase n=1 Tax=Serratia marcescens TaxID=615 RepID=UPI000E0F5602|nr:integrase [Serratia marcescens]